MTGSESLLDRAVRRARWTILWERIWPPLAALLTVFGLFLALSWLGVWLWLPPIGRAIGVVLLAIAALAASRPLSSSACRRGLDGLRRLDPRSGLRHRPATAVTDRLAVTGQRFDVARAVAARISNARCARRSNLKAGWPMPQLAARDPSRCVRWSLVLVIATYFSAGGDRDRRVAAAFNWHGVVAPANFRIDAWVTPPAYTARPPVILPGLRPGEPVRASAPIAVPVRLGAGDPLHRRDRSSTSL